MRNPRNVQPLVLRRWRGAVVVVTVSAGAIGTLSCLQVNSDHCALRGGDFGCPSRQICIIPTEPVSDESVEANGCHEFSSSDARHELALDAAPSGFVRAPFGLPTRFEQASMGDLGSLEGVLDAALAERGRSTCEVELGDLNSEFLTFERDVRSAVDRKGRLRVDAVGLNASRTMALSTFNQAVNNELVVCDDEVPPDTDTGTGSSSDTTVDAGSGTGSGTDESSSTTGPQPCTSNDMCNPATPICDSGTCVGCSELPTPDAACAERYPNTPVCFEDRCVPCTASNQTLCDAQLLTCDAEAMECVPCQEHDECVSGACDLLLAALDVPEDPECFEPEYVFDAGLPVDMDEQNYPTIEEALAAVDTLMLDRAVIRLNNSLSPMLPQESAIVDSGAIAFIVANGHDPLWTRNVGDGHLLEVSGDNTRVYLDGIDLSESGAMSSGLSCDSASVDIRRSELLMNDGGSIEAFLDCNIDIQTSFIGGNVADFSPINVQNSSLTMLYTTVGAGLGNIPAVSCNEISNLEIRNSIIVTRDGGSEFNCSPDSLEYSVTNNIDTGTNHAAGPFGPFVENNWFIDYGGDLHLDSAIPTMGTGNGASVFDHRAQWQTGDPTTDIDGDLRPTVNGSMDHAGADIP